MNNATLLATLQQAQFALDAAVRALKDAERKPAVKVTRKSDLPPPKPYGLNKPRGDIGIVRKCLNGCNYPSDQIIYNNLRKDGTRRIKIWVAGSIKNSSEAKQGILWHTLGQAFGEKFISAQYLPNPPWWIGSHNLTIILKS